MTAQEKKELILSILSKEGEKRSYWEIAADLELQLWTERYKMYAVKTGDIPPE